MYNMDWLNKNSNRSYPLKVDSSMYDISRRNRVPSNFLVDAILGTPVNYQFEFYISKIEYSPELLYVVISSETGEEALAGTLQNPVPEAHNFVVSLEGNGAYLGAYGKLIIGSLEDMPYGSFEYLQQDLQIETCRVIRVGLGITSINGITDGNVSFRTKSNVVITPDVGAKKINIDTFDGLCACADCPTAKTANGQPVINNNLVIEGIGCVQVSPVESGVKISNQCEDACCGCDEVNDMVDRINDLMRRISALETAP